MKKRLALLCILPVFGLTLVGCSAQTQSDLTLRGPVGILNDSRNAATPQAAANGTESAAHRVTADHLLALIGMQEHDLVATLGEGRRAAGRNEGFRAYQEMLYGTPGTIAVSFDPQRTIDAITLTVDRSEESHWMALLQTKFGELSTQDNVTHNLLENHEINVSVARSDDDLIITFSRSHRQDGMTM